MNDAEMLNEQHAAVIRRWARTIADMGERVPAGLLDDLAEIAGRHAACSKVRNARRPATTRSEKKES